MRRFRLAALGLLLCAALAVGGAPVASAAPSVTMTWFVYGTTVEPDDWVAACTDQFVQTGQTLLVQWLRGATWVTIHRFGPASLVGQECVETRARQLVPGTGRYRLRAVLEDASARVLAAAEQSINVQPASIDVTTESMPDSTTTARSRRVTVRLSAAYGQRVKLQRRSSSGWHTVSQVRARGTTVTLPVPTRVGLSTYRVVSGAGTWSATAVSPRFTIHQTDTVRYASYIKRARRYMARYCPRTPIYIDTPGVAAATAGATIGLAWRWTSYGDHTETLRTYIELRSGLRGRELRHVALHECGHIVQDRAIVKDRYELDEAAADRLYPRVGIEGQADCMAYYFVRWKPALAYLSGCSRAQLRDAARMWRAYGKRYQAPVYTWRISGFPFGLSLGRGKSGTVSEQADIRLGASRSSALA